jgi:polysaccharide export outer membrane protein
LSTFAASAYCLKVFAQQNSTPAITSAINAPKPLAEDTRYRIGPGDVLAIITRKAPELSVEAVRVDQQGKIRIPMIEGDITAACRTEHELAAQIATLYSEYKNNPSVEVFVRDFQSRPVAVIGAVNGPGQFRLQRQVRLLELLSYAGGPSDKAGRVVDVIHTGGPNICENGPAEVAAAGASPELGVFKLTDTLKGKEGSNPFVQPGDIVSLPEADQVFVVGYVYQPRAIFLKDKPITVSRAVAMAGGPTRDSKTSRIRIVRQTGETGGKETILVDLNAIEKQKAPDIALLPNDIVEVPSSVGKVIFNAFTGAIAPALSQGTIRMIP